MSRDKEIEEINRKIDLLLKRESQIISALKTINKKEDQIAIDEKKEIRQERSIKELEKEEIEELKRIERIELDVKKSILPHPLTKVTYRDIIKGAIGAFVGIVGHFSFMEAVPHSEHISFLRATLILISSFLIGILFIYYSGFRKVREVRVLSFIPVRVTVIFAVAISVIVIVFALFGIINTHSTFLEVYKMVSLTSIIAMLGAGTADLIGER